MSNINTANIGTRNISNPASPNPLQQPATLESEDFAGVLRSMLVGVNTAQQNSQKLTTAFERGQHQDLVGVMVAQQTAKLNFQSTLQVRNKMVSAYQDIMNMPV